MKDLSAVLCHGDTLSAVFNDLYHVGCEQNAGFEVLNEKQERVLYVLKLISANISTSSIISIVGNEGTVIAFGPEIFENSQDRIGDHYLRFRLRLDRDLKGLFGRRFIPKETPFIPSFNVLDPVEFRLNERRNISRHLKEKYKEMHFPKIFAIHYFLITNVRTEIIRNHESFIKMRLLEPSLWDHYLDSLGRVQADNLVIYQWRRTSSFEVVVDDFIALAIFKKGYDNILRYVLMAFVVGAFGSTLSTFLMAAVSWLLTPSTERHTAQYAIISSLIVLVLLFVALVCFAQTIERSVRKL